MTEYFPHNAIISTIKEMILPAWSTTFSSFQSTDMKSKSRMGLEVLDLAVVSTNFSLESQLTLILTISNDRQLRIWRPTHAYCYRTVPLSSHPSKQSSFSITGTSAHSGGLIGTRLHPFICLQNIILRRVNVPLFASLIRARSWNHPLPNEPSVFYSTVLCWTRGIKQSSSTAA